MVQSACCYHFLLRFESSSKMEGYEGYFTRWIWWSILTFFTIFDISLLWMDKFGWNWWPNWRVFDALTESGKIFDQYDPQNFWETLEAGAKKWIFSPFWLLWSNNLGTSEIKNDKKSVGKLNYCSRPNQWCNRHVNRLKHIDLAKLQRSVGIIKWLFGHYEPESSAKSICFNISTCRLHHLLDLEQ